jgi:hypothetical protein
MLKSYNLAQGEGAAQVPALALLVPKGALEVGRRAAGASQALVFAGFRRFAAPLSSAGLLPRCL